MKARDLIKELSKFDSDIDVVCHSEDQELAKSFFDITEVAESEGERERLEDGTAYLKFGKSSKSLPIVIVEITSDF